MFSLTLKVSSGYAYPRLETTGLDYATSIRMEMTVAKRGRLTIPLIPMIE
jgi:hypothetical protein